MAIADVSTHTHLSTQDVEAIADELDAARRDVEESLGAKGAAYIVGRFCFSERSM